MSPAVYDAACPAFATQAAWQLLAHDSATAGSVLWDQKGQVKPHLLLHAPQPCEHILRLSGKGPRFLALREEVVELLQRPAWDLERARILQCSNEQYVSV